MPKSQWTTRLERPEDTSQIEDLHRIAFGPGRFVRAAFLIREGSLPVAELCFSVHVGDRLIASVRHTEIHIGATPALLLGPLAVHPDFAGRGIGKALLKRSVDGARGFGARLIMLVGDRPYYAPFGFKVMPPGQVILPAPADPARLLVAELETGAADGLTGRAVSVPMEQARS